MKRPLFVSMLFLTLGITAGHYAFDAFVLFFVLVCALCAALYFIYKRIGYVLIFSVLFLFGFFGVKANLSGQAELDGYAENGTELEMDGVVMDMGVTSGGRQKLVVRIFQVNDGTKATECDIKIQAITEKDEDVWISRGIRLRGSLEFLDGPRNLGGFDEALYLKSRRIMYKTFPVILEKGDTAVRIENYTALVKNMLANIYDESLPPREAGTVKAMIIGDRAGLEEDLSELFRNVGIFHILAISGLHVSVLGMMLDLLLGRYFGGKFSGLVTIVFLVLYCIMTGCAVSSVRAAIMTSAVISARLLNRSADLTTSTALAAICLLVYRPLYLWDIGFQYSFGAVFGIAFFTEPIERGAEFLCGKSKYLAFVFGGRYVKKYLPATLAATIATTPVMMFHFYCFPVYAIIVNMIIVPSVFIVLMFGVTVGLLGFISIELSSLFSGPVFFVLRVYEGIAAFFADLPFSVILTGKPPLWLCVYWYATAFCVAYLLRSIGKNRFIDKKYFTALLVVPLAAACIYGLKTEKLIVDMLDVGQGESIAITGTGLTFLVDGGGSNIPDTVSSTGARIIKPYLDYRGIGKIDAVFISHFDADHVAGVLEILELKRVGKVYIPDIGLISKIDAETRKNYDLLISLGEKYRIPIEILSAGEKVLAGGISFECLNPYRGKTYADSNTASLVLRLGYGQTDILLTGDIDTAAEKYIIEQAGDVGADILALAHHGSKYSNHEGFIEAVAPRAAIVGTGRNNLYGHPAEAVREILRARGIPLYNTAECGMIRIMSDGSEMSIETIIKTIIE